MSTTRAALSGADRALVLRALKYPRGRYSAERASQLSSIPARTLHDWTTSGSLVPDWAGARPRGWSYRDVVYARLLGWLRSKHMDRSRASERVGHLRDLLATSDIDPAVHSDGTIFLIGDEAMDRFTGQQAFDGLAELLDVFVLTEAIEGVSNGDLWGPSLCTRQLTRSSRPGSLGASRASSTPASRLGPFTRCTPNEVWMPKGSSVSTPSSRWRRSTMLWSLRPASERRSQRASAARRGLPVPAGIPT